MAKTFVGLNEQENTEVLAKFFNKSLGQKIDPRATPWCAAFVNSVLSSSGQEGTKSLMARSFLKYGKSVETPSEGDIVVIQRGGRNSPTGHVGFYAGRTEDGLIKVLGGNQSNGVNIKTFPEDKVLGYRKPPSRVQLRFAMRDQSKIANKLEDTE